MIKQPGESNMFFVPMTCPRTSGHSKREDFGEKVSDPLPEQAGLIAPKIYHQAE
ncbi:MAG: hypothetical protein HY208_04960 [Nitrospirae bacterium]|nr:hypothetical protein [Nitrospirota bacterium]